VKENEETAEQSRAIDAAASVAGSICCCDQSTKENEEVKVKVKVRKVQKVLEEADDTQRRQQQQQLICLN